MYYNSTLVALHERQQIRDKVRSHQRNDHFTLMLRERPRSVWPGVMDGAGNL